MSLSKVLESIYADKPQQDTIDFKQSAQVPSALPGTEQNSPIGKSPEDYDKDDMNVPSPESELGDDSMLPDEDCDECPKVTLAHSLIQWIKDNAETIHDVLDAVESGEYDEMDDMDNADIDLGGDDQSPMDFGAGETGDQQFDDPEADIKAKEFEEKDQFSGFGFDEENNDQTEQSPEMDMGEEPSQDQPMGDEGSIDDLEPDDPDRQGDIRSVQDAHLVFKRKTADGTFEELWFYNVGDDASRSDDDIKRDILSGTSIDPKKLASEDGKQQYTIVTMGNGQMVHIVGMES